MKSTALSIVIISHGKSPALLTLVATIIKQCTKNDEILIISRVSPHFKYTFPSQAHIFIQPSYSQSQARNYAVKTAKYDWIVFIDDDCIPESRWLHQVRKSTTPSTICVQGQCDIGNPANIWSVLENLTMHVYQYVPDAKTLMNGAGIKLTTKNLLINKKRFPFLPIFPDISRSDVHEDALLLLKLNGAGIRPLYNPRMRVRHSPDAKMHKYFMKLIIDGKTLYWKHILSQVRQKFLNILFKTKLSSISKYNRFEFEMSSQQKKYLRQHYSSIKRGVIILIFHTCRPLLRGIGYQLEKIRNNLSMDHTLLKYLDIS